MILFFRFLGLFFCFFSLSQEKTSEPLLVAKDSVSFYSFTKKGVSFFRFNDQNELIEKFVNYDKSVPNSFQDVEPTYFSAISSRDVVYFLYPGGGVLYRFKNNVIERIDESFAHRNQLTGSFFMHNEELYLLGGYGYWESNSYLTKFDFQSGNWNLVSVSGQIPEKGINQGTYVKKEAVISVFNFYETTASSSKLNANLYELDLEAFTWSKKGAMNSAFNHQIEKAIQLIKIPFKESIIQNSPNSFVFQIISPFNNSFKTYETSMLNQLGRNSITVGDRIVYYTLNAEGLGFNLVVKNVFNLLLSPSEEVLYNDTSVLVVYLAFAGSLLLILFLTVIVYFKKTNKAFYLSSNSIYTEEKSILLNKDEKYFLKLLTNSRNEIVENILILNYFKDELISLDAAIKRKNKMISSLNKKFFERFKLLLTSQKVDPKDSRQVYYTLNHSIKLVSKKF